MKYSASAGLIECTSLEPHGLAKARTDIGLAGRNAFLIRIGQNFSRMILLMRKHIGSPAQDGRASFFGAQFDGGKLQP